MSQLALLGGSLAAILLLALVARLLNLGGARLTNETEAREIAEATFADFISERVWLDRDGSSAIVSGRDGSIALLRRLGAHFVTRKAIRPMPVIVQGPVLVIASGERLLGSFSITLESAAEARLLTPLLGSGAPNA